MSKFNKLLRKRPIKGFALYQEGMGVVVLKKKMMKHSLTVAVVPMKYYDYLVKSTKAHRRHCK